MEPDSEDENGHTRLDHVGARMATDWALPVVQRAHSRSCDRYTRSLEPMRPVLALMSSEQADDHVNAVLTCIRNLDNDDVGVRNGVMSCHWLPLERALLAFAEHYKANIDSMYRWRTFAEHAYLLLAAMNEALDEKTNDDLSICYMITAEAAFETIPPLDFEKMQSIGRLSYYTYTALTSAARVMALHPQFVDLVGEKLDVLDVNPPECLKRHADHIKEALGLACVQLRTHVGILDIGNPLLERLFDRLFAMEALPRSIPHPHVEFRGRRDLYEVWCRICTLIRFGIGLEQTLYECASRIPVLDITVLIGSSLPAANVLGRNIVRWRVPMRYEFMKVWHRRSVDYHCTVRDRQRELSVPEDRLSCGIASVLSFELCQHILRLAWPLPAPAAD